MKVRNLIEALKQINPNTEIQVLAYEDYEGCFLTPNFSIIEIEKGIFLGLAEE